MSLNQYIDSKLTILMTQPYLSLAQKLMCFYSSREGDNHDG